MLNKTQETMSIIKLKQLVAIRFGKNMEVRQLMGLSAPADASEMTLKGHDFHIPIGLEGHYLGTAVVNGAADLAEEVRKDLSQVVRMVLEPTLYNWYLERKESNLNQLATANFPTDNLQLFGEKQSELPNYLREVDDRDNVITGNDDSLARPHLISNLVHLEGKNLLMIKKVSLQIHDMSHRWAFVPFADIKAQLASALDISKMGAMTIFVEDVISLSSAEQDLLLEYLGSPRSNEEPLIITSSPLRAGELRTSDLHPHFIDELEINSFEVDRAPLGYHNLKEVLELFFLRDEDFKV